MVEFGVFNDATLKPVAAMYSICIYYPEWCEENIPGGIGF
jgi:hypothetical protein